MREVCIYGENQSARYTVHVNNQLAQSYKSDLIYRFETESTVHGSYSVRIAVTEGSLILQSSLARYPAWINGKQSKISLPQPFDTPLYTWKNHRLVPLLFPIIIKSGEVLEFEHVMMNGPDYWEIEVDDSCKFSDCLYIGDLYKEEYIPELLNKKAIYNYQRQPNDIHNPAHLNELLQEIEAVLGRS